MVKSKIHGKGVVCTRRIKKGNKVALAITGKRKRTDIGRFVNHSSDPNVKLVKIGQNYYLYAVKDILPKEEIVGDYNDTPDFIAKADPTWD